MEDDIGELVSTDEELVIGLNGEKAHEESKPLRAIRSPISFFVFIKHLLKEF